MEGIKLSLSQEYEIEKLNRAIDETSNLKQLQDVCKSLIKAWMIQKAATLWIMKQHLPPGFMSQNKND